MNKFYQGEEQFNRISGNPGVRNNEKSFTAPQKDYARLLHSPAFRRLQNKTQLFPGHESDFFRNRLTHSLEVAQIAKGITRKINKEIGDKNQEIDENIVDFAAIAHDLGHPPFGHNGEAALNEIMWDSGGFEGNAQTLRILCNIESRAVKNPSNEELHENCGLDLTFRSLASVIKYDQRIPLKNKNKKLKKGYYATEEEIVKKIKKSLGHEKEFDKFKTIECSIMDIADDIAYSTYDLEDSLHAGFSSPMFYVEKFLSDEDIQNNVIRKTNQALEECCYKKLDGLEEVLIVIAEIFFGGIDEAEIPDNLHNDIKRIFKSLIYWKINLKYTKEKTSRTLFTSERVGCLVDAVKLNYNERHPYLSKVYLDRCDLLKVEVLKHLNYELVIRSPQLVIVEHRGKNIVGAIFDAYLNSDGDLLPTDWRKKYRATDNVIIQKRILCDYISGMTDRYAMEIYNRLYDEGISLYKPI